jgi:putative MATE family efflux protein
MSTTELELVKDQDDIIVSGSTWAAIWHMSWPGLLNMITIAIASFADVWVAGKLGPQVQAAIGIGGQIWFFMTFLAVALSAGTTALVSRFCGARDHDGAVEAARQSLVFAFLFGFVSTAIGLMLARPLYHWLGATPAVEALGWDYLKFDLLSQVPFTTLWVAHSIFRAKGNPRVPLFVWLVMMILIIALDVGLCLSPLNLGVKGIGISWLVAAVVGLTVDIVLLKRSDLGACVDFRPILRHGLSQEWLLRLLNVGLPACIQDLAWVGGNFVMIIIFAQTIDPTSCQAAWAVGLRLEEMVAGMPIYALAMAVGTIVGQNLGAQQADRAERAGWQCAAIGSVFNAFVGLMMFFFALPIAQLMSHDMTVTLYTQQYLQIVGASEPFVALWLILFGAMQGAGYTKWPMWASTFCLLVLRLPLAWYLTVPLGMVPTGTWFGIAISSTFIGLVAIWRFKTGVWKAQKV